MLIKNKKIYIICLIACIITMVAGLVLSSIKVTANLGDALYVVSWPLGILVGSMRVYKDFLKWVFRKKETTVIALSFYFLLFKWMFKLVWIIMAIFGGFLVCLMYPALAGIIAFFRYKDELIEA